MTPGMRADGPAVITEAETTVVVPRQFDIIAQTDGCLDLNRLHETGNNTSRGDENG